MYVNKIIVIVSDYFLYYFLANLSSISSIED